MTQLIARSAAVHYERPESWRCRFRAMSRSAASCLALSLLATELGSAGTCGCTTLVATASTAALLIPLRPRMFPVGAAGGDGGGGTFPPGTLPALRPRLPMPASLPCCCCCCCRRFARAESISTKRFWWSACCCRAADLLGVLERAYNRAVRGGLTLFSIAWTSTNN